MNYKVKIIRISNQIKAIRCLRDYYMSTPILDIAFVTSEGKRLESVNPSGWNDYEIGQLERTISGHHNPLEICVEKIYSKEEEDDIRHKEDFYKKDQDARDWYNRQNPEAKAMIDRLVYMSGRVMAP